MKKITLIIVALVLFSITSYLIVITNKKKEDYKTFKQQYIELEEEYKQKITLNSQIEIRKKQYSELLNTLEKKEENIVQKNSEYNKLEKKNTELKKNINSINDKIKKYDNMILEIQNKINKLNK